MSANSHTAIFKDPNGNLIESGISDQINTKFTQATEIIEFIELNQKHEYLTKIYINDSGTAMPAIIDTGATLMALNSKVAQALGINYTQGKKVNIATAGGNVTGFKVMLSKIQLGRIIQNEVEALVMEGDSPGIILIGMSFLKMLELKYSDNRLELKLDNNSNP